MDGRPTGRPRGTKTVYWTAKERKLVRGALDYASTKLPHRTQRAIINMMIRMMIGEVVD